MKSSFFIVLSILLVGAILTPSIITLAKIDENKALVLDFNEEEKKEEQKEVNEKEFFLESDIKLSALLQREKSSISSFYVESEYSTSIVIFLPPPKYII